MYIIEKPYREVGRDKMYNIWHRIDNGAELIYVVRGSGSIVFRSGVYPLKSGSLYYIARGAMHYTLPDEPQNYDRIKLVLSPEVIDTDKEISNFLSDKEAVIASLPPTAERKVCELLSSFSGDADTKMKNAEMLASALGLLVALCRNSTDKLEKPKEIVAGAVAYLNSHLCDPISIDSVCAEVHASKFYLCHRFKAQMGMTIMQYVTKTRIELAKELLGESDTSVSKAAEKCGFTNVSYFCAVFKKETGSSPLLFSKRATKGKKQQ